MNKTIPLTWFALVLFFINCMPERDNPYDPKLPYKNNSKITGRVTTKVGNPIKSAHISLIFLDNRLSISTITDTTGCYEIEYYHTSMLGDSALLTANKIMFDVENIKLSISANRYDTINFILDALPQFNAESIYSYHEALIYPGDIYNIRTSVKVNDADGFGDIDSVFLFIPIFEMSIALDFYPGYIYKQIIPVEVFPDTSLEELIGQNCYFEVLSKSGVRTRSNIIRLNRVIYDIPQLIYPLGDTVSQYFTFFWHRNNLAYPYSYGIEVSLLPPNNIPQIVYQKYDLSSIDTLYTLPLSLMRGRYLWRVMIKDNFGNISKSYLSVFYLE